MCFQSCIICNNLDRINESLHDDDDDTAEEPGMTKPQRFSF